MSKDLYSSERFVVDSLDKLKPVQLWRYVRALDYISKDDKVVDLGCGIGFGCHILSHKAKSVIGIDYSDEAIEYANKHWKKNNNVDFYTSTNCIDTDANAVTMFEVLEHIENPIELLKSIYEIDNLKKVIVTVPHVSRPIDECHVKHYTEEILYNELQLAGFKNIKIEKLYNKNIVNRVVIWGVAEK